MENFKWNPKCLFMLLYKESEFIENVRENVLKIIFTNVT